MLSYKAVFFFFFLLGGHPGWLMWDPCSVTLVLRVIHILDCRSTQSDPSFNSFSSFKPLPLSSICLSDQDLTSHLQRPAHLVTPNLLLIVSWTYRPAVVKLFFFFYFFVFDSLI